MLVRISISLLLTIVVAPALPALPVVPVFSAAAYVLVIQQVLIGVALGLVMQIAFAAVELAGDMVGLQMGLSFASFVDPQNSEQTPIVGGFLSLTLMLVMTAINAHLLLLAGLVETFNTFPIDLGVSQWNLWQRLVVAGGQLFIYGLQIAFPVITALILTNVTLGVLTRASPQLNVFSIGFPVTVIVGFLMLIVTLPFGMPVLERVLYHALGFFA